MIQTALKNLLRFTRMCIPLLSHAKNFLDFEISGNKLFFKSISKIASLYNLTSQGHKYARFELYRIISKIDKLRITYQKNIEQMTTSLADYKVELKTLRSIEVNLSNPVNNYLFEIMTKVDLIKEYDTLVYIKRGGLNKNSILYSYLKQIKGIISDAYKINIKSISDTSVNDSQQSIYDASLGHYLLPTA